MFKALEGNNHICITKFQRSIQFLVTKLTINENKNMIQQKMITWGISNSKHVQNSIITPTTCLSMSVLLFWNNDQKQNFTTLTETNMSSSWHHWLAFFIYIEILSQVSCAIDRVIRVNSVAIYLPVHLSPWSLNTTERKRALKIKLYDWFRQDRFRCSYPISRINTVPIQQLVVVLFFSPLFRDYREQHRGPIW